MLSVMTKAARILVLHQSADGLVAVKRLRGLGRTALGYLRAVVGKIFVDRLFGLDTAGMISKKKLGIDAGDSLHYEPSSWLALKRILPPREVDQSDVFLDIGSGKGRIVYQAAQYPFKRVIGVEISEELNEIARRNIARSRRRLRAPVEIHTADAADFELPTDVTVVYMYNPFIGQLFAQVIDNLIQSVDDHPRPLRLICRAPMEEEYLLKTGRFELVKMVAAPRPTRRWATRGAMRMYTALPQSAVATSQPLAATQSFAPAQA